jgi:serine/threonine-protein kinase HipA
MARRRRSSSLKVLLNGRQLGSLNRAANGAVDFRYIREWLDWDYALPLAAFSSSAIRSLQMM